MKNLITRFLREEEGQDLIEYALLAGFIALVVAAGVQILGQGVNTLYGNVNTKVGTAAS